ncbi:MAG: preprotein translocase subunit SecY [Candidatus Izemoplasmatales bacterium]|jgi:preprotein translocase subunit SecY|nr:preprotein translocase subunit SecY [Candidatus Izemoplasmatales bacterium]MDD3865579.1 preprotein translocase subunit SecY [Candidatus Izemoplasmatales bacterium]
METLKKVFRNKDMMKRIGFTLLAFFIFKLLTYVTMPLIDATKLQSLFENSGFLGIVNSISGDALRNYSIIALGISPYITSSIVIQLLQMDIIPALKEWGEEGEVGKAKTNRLVRYVAIGLAFIQAIAMTFAFDSQSTSLWKFGVESWATAGGADLWFLVYFYIAVVLTAGTAFMIWLADQITLHGIGNGSSMLIVGGIIISFPGTITSLIQYYILGDSTALSTVYSDPGSVVAYILFAVCILLFIIILVGITYMEGAQRRIPIQYANRPAGSKFAGKSESNIPIKLNTSGVIPVIFASIILSLPVTIFNYIDFGDSSALENWLNQIFSSSEPIGFAIYMILIFAFSFFYSFIIVSPEKIATNLQKQNAYIPGVRPGFETETYLTKTLFKVTIVGALYLVVVAILPIVVSMILGHSYAQVGGTSLLIIVGVALETAKQIETDTQDKAYVGFMR